MSEETVPYQKQAEPERQESDPLFYPLLGILGLTLLSGLFLAVYYIPTFTQAFPSVERLNEEVPFGWFVRRIHATGATFFFVVMLLSLLRFLYTGGYKLNPRSSWTIGILLFLMGVISNLTGFFLPLSQSSFWGTVNILSDLASIPWIGDFLANLLRGGKELGGVALIRFYGAHIGVGVFMAFLFFKVYKTVPEMQEKRWSFFSLVVTVGVILAATTFLPYWFSDSLKEAANPAVNPEHIIPPWYFFFFEEALRFFTGAYPSWTGFALVLSLVALFALPFVDRGPQRKLLLRPMILGLGATSLVVFFYFSLLGVASAHYGEKVILPAGFRSASVVRGAQVFAQRNCAYCHQVFGREGRREGPDISRMKDRHRSADWIRRYILNARLYRPGTTMPRYEIPLEDLEALSAYLLAFDSKNGRFEVVDRTELLDLGLYLYPRLEDQGGTKR